MRSIPHRRKDVLITGASGVIGHAVAERLADAGYRVHLAGRERQRLIPLHRELSSQGAGAPLLLLNLSDPAGCAEAVRKFFRNANDPYGLVCCAGHLGPVGPFWSTPFDRWQHSFSENFIAHACMIHAFSKAMAARRRRGSPRAARRRRPGAIVVLSGAGIGSQADFSNVTSYSASKAALVHLVEALAQEFKPLGMTINAVAPGAVLSSMTEQARRGGKADPKGFVSPELAAELIEHLMSPATRTVSGRLLSARFDQAIVRAKKKAIENDPHWLRLRRIDYALFAPVKSS